MMRARLVTGYVPIPNHPRTAQEYGDLGEKLGGVPVPKKAFYMRFQDTWLAKHLLHLSYTPIPSQSDNPLKNTNAYHCVNHEKTTWLRQAAEEYPADDVFVWVDYGIFRLPGINNQAIYEFMERVDDKAIYVPGCWDKPEVVESVHPCWRFCGSVIAVPRKHIELLDYTCRVQARHHIARTRNVWWEVNTWAMAEIKERKLPFHWYKADHDVSMFTNLELKS